MAENGAENEGLNDLINWALERLSQHFDARNPPLSAMDKSTILATVSARLLCDALDESEERDLAGEQHLRSATCDLFNDLMKERAS